ncbi:MAG: hypothetical protein V1767_00715 [Chloroflexota bacterium]
MVARLRKPSPLALDLLIQLFEPPQGLNEFLDLIREFLPEREEKIMAIKGSGERMQEFADIFSDHYFPLINEAIFDDDQNGYSALTNECPVRFQALTNLDYNEITQSEDETEIILAYVLENPWHDDDRPAFAEAALPLIGDKLIRHIPKDGFPIDKMEDWLKDTEFEPVAFWGSVISQVAGNVFFDCPYDIEESGAQYQVSWDRPTIERLVLQWHEFEDWQINWGKFKEWFTKDLVKNTTNLLRILKERSKNDGDSDSDDPLDPIIDPNQGRLFDILSDDSTMAGTGGSTNTTGQAESPFGLL